MHKLSAVVLHQRRARRRHDPCSDCSRRGHDAQHKAIQPGLFEVAGPRVLEALAAGLTKITAAPGKGGKSIEVESP